MNNFSQEADPSPQEKNNPEKVFVIVGGGDLTPAFLRERLEACPGAFVVAADRGLKTLLEIGKMPDHVLGDFDSVDRESLEEYKKAAVKEGTVDTFPAVKDFTDTEAAINYALCRGAGRIVLLGMTGGRLDHFLANVHNLLIPLEKNVPCVIEDPQNRLFLMKGGQKMTLKKAETFGQYLSVIPLTTDLKGLTLEGVKYPLDNASVCKGISLCVSNEISEEEARISLNEGIMAVILSKG